MIGSDMKRIIFLLSVCFSGSPVYSGPMETSVLTVGQNALTVGQNAPIRNANRNRLPESGKERSAAGPVTDSPVNTGKIIREIFDEYVSVLQCSKKYYVIGKEAK